MLHPKTKTGRSHDDSDDDQGNDDAFFVSHSQCRLVDY